MAHMYPLGNWRQYLLVVLSKTSIEEDLHERRPLLILGMTGNDSTFQGGYRGCIGLRVQVLELRVLKKARHRT